jgi:hypothetical protein
MAGRAFLAPRHVAEGSKSALTSEVFITFGVDLRECGRVSVPPTG